MIPHPIPVICDPIITAYHVSIDITQPAHSFIHNTNFRILDLLPLKSLRRLQPKEHNHADGKNTHPTDRICDFSPCPPIHAREKQRPNTSAQLAPTPQVAQFASPLVLTGFEAAQGVQARDDSCSGDCEERSRGVQSANGVNSSEKEERQEA